jgi:uncharacterized protein (DUF4415 family)
VLRGLDCSPPWGTSIQGEWKGYRAIRLGVAYRAIYQERQAGIVQLIYVEGAAPAWKTRIAIRVDDDILDWFRGQADAAGGGNYQSMINEALRTIATEGAAKIETVVRRVAREELKRLGEHKGAKRAKAA